MDTVKQATDLLNQQIWCWGQDIDRPEGNWLQALGFKRSEPPETRKNCPSIYALSINERCRITLRGFGVFYGDDLRGGVFIRRYGFEPRFTDDPHLHCPPWSSEDLPAFGRPANRDTTTCVLLLLGLVDWIREYEVGIVSQLGLSYRHKTLVDWNNGKRAVIPAEQMAASWRRLSLAIASKPADWLVPSVNNGLVWQRTVGWFAQAYNEVPEG